MNEPMGQRSSDNFSTDSAANHGFGVATETPLASTHNTFRDPTALLQGQFGNIPPQVPRGAQIIQPNQLEKPDEITGKGVDARSEAPASEVAEKKITSTGGAPGSAQGRLALLQSALNRNLVEFLVDGVLENQTLSKVKDPGAVKVHAVELLKLLASDPGFGMKFVLILESLPAWAKYKSQDFSLFITGAEQRSDYFLTSGTEERKLLTDGN